MTDAMVDRVVPPSVPEGQAPAARETERADADVAVVSGPAPKWVIVVTLVAVSVVAAVAAIVSYIHMRELATQAGEEWRADIIPLSADGLLVAASMVMLVRRRSRQPAGVLPWAGLVLGLTASLAANLAVADWTNPVSIAVSGWPPLALAVAFELLILVTRERGPDVLRSGAAHPVQQVPAEPAATEQEPAGVEQPRPARKPKVVRKPTVADRTDDELLVEVRAMADRAGRKPSGRAVRSALNVGPDRANRLLEEFDRTGPRRTA